MGCLPQAAWPEDFSPKSQDAVALQQIKERGALPWLIVVISVRKRRPLQQYPGLHCRALVMVSSSRPTAWLQNSKRAERSVDVWAESPRLSPLWLSASSSACHGLLIITDNAITYKARRDKNARELKLANATFTALPSVGVMCVRSMQNTRRVADAKAENDALRDDVLPLVVSVAASKQSVSQCVKPPPPSGVDNAASRLAVTAEQDYFAPSERGWSLCKNNWEEPRKYINEQCR